MVNTSEQLHSTKPDLKVLRNVMGTILRQVIKAFNLFQLIENETMEIFSMRVRNKSKHKFTGMKVSKTVECKRMFKA